MRVLVACEFSGAVRDAFITKGHDAMSCDLLPSETPGPHHQGDVLDVLDDGWDLMIAHPPCTYLTNSGVRWLHSDHDRWKLMLDGAVFFRRLLEAPIPRVAVENPIMHGYAAKIVGRRQDQVIQPWMFGHPEQKATGLWLRGLPPLVATEDVKAAMLALPKAESQRVHYASPGADRWKLRSVTYAGIAAAMAEQWGFVGIEAVA
jgi:hypothetical protein